MITTKITRKITGYAVKNPDTAPTSQVSGTPEPLTRMTPDWKRPDVLSASVYKIKKCPNSPDAAVYVTISNAVLGDQVVPAEIFINSKDASHRQWVDALTRIISAIFRQGGDLGFLVEELLGIHDPKAGFLGRGVWHPSLVSQVGLIIKEHLESIRMSSDPSLKEALKDYFEPDTMAKLKKADEADEAENISPYPPNAVLCTKCHHKAVVVSDGCSLCLNCSDSRCG